MRSRSLPSLFFRSLFISAVTVGGGYVILAALRSFYTVRKRLISDEDMDDIAVIAQSAPGAVAVNASLLVGYRLRSVPGALVSALGTLVPPVAVMSALALLTGAVRGVPVLSGLMLGMRAGAAAVILDTAIDMTRPALLVPRTGSRASGSRASGSRASGTRADSGKTSPRKTLSPLRAVLFALSLWLCLFTSLSSLWILLASAVIGGAGGMLAMLKNRPAREREPSVPRAGEKTA